MEKKTKIRFNGFTDEWEQRKVGDIGTIQTCKRIFKEQTSTQGEIPFFKNGTLGLKPDAFITRETFEEYKKNFPFPKVGDVLMSVVGSIGRTAEYTGKDEYFQDSNIVWLDTSSDIIDKRFLQVSYQIIDWIIEGSTIKHLYNDNILASKIWMPSLLEQKKIGEFLYKLDNLITLHQCKCDETKELKRFMLQKMFPRNGEKKPEIRFAGFTDSWEQRKLGEVTKLCKEKAKEKEYQVYSVTNSQGFIPQSEQFEDREIASKNRSNYSIVRKNQFAYNPSRINVGSIAYLKEDKNVIISPLYVVFECLSSLDKDFLIVFLNTSSFSNQREVNTAGSVRDSLSYDGFSEINIMLPALEEQKKIGLLFEQLDNLINLHQCKCDEYKELKKYMLQNMFPQKG